MSSPTRLAARLSLLLFAVVGAGAARAADDPACASTPQPLAWSIGRDAERPVAVIDAQAVRGRRVWIDAEALSDGDKPMQGQLQLVFDAPAGGTSWPIDFDALSIPPHGTQRLRLSAWVAPQVQRIEVRGFYGTLARAGVVTLRLTCTRATLSEGEPSSQQALLDEAVGLYLATAFPAPIDPTRARRVAQSGATGAQAPAEVWPAVRAMLADAGDHHSYLVPRSSRAAFAAWSAPAPPVVRLRDDGLALVAISQAGFAGDAAAERAYATHLHAAIAEVAARHPRGWILDLRGCGGGDMWPMLAGLSALVAGPEVGAFVGREGRETWLVRAGTVGTAKFPVILTITGDPGPDIDATIAVLIGPGTGSSGEATALAFWRRPHTRFFGHPTRGGSNSGVEQSWLSDGTLFAIANVLNADRTGQVREGAIVPDVVASATEDPVQQAAAWLLQQAH